MYQSNSIDIEVKSHFFKHCFSVKTYERVGHESDFVHCFR